MMKRGFGLGAWVLAVALAACGDGGGDTGPTLGGIDANTNGVRDDIERHIERKYTEPAQRKAAMQSARTYQRMLLLDKSDPVAVEAVVVASARAVDCVFDTFPGADGSELSRELEAMSTNTKDRLMAYIAFNKAASGSVSGSFKGHGCD